MVRCSFCGKSQSQVDKLISGKDAYICGECVDVCQAMLHEHDAPVEPPSGEAHPLAESVGIDRLAGVLGLLQKQLSELSEQLGSMADRAEIEPDARLEHA